MNLFLHKCEHMMGFLICLCMCMCVSGDSYVVMFVHTHTSKRACMHTQIHACTCIHTCINARMHNSRRYSHIYTYIPIYLYTHTHTHTHTHTRARARSFHSIPTDSIISMRVATFTPRPARVDNVDPSKFEQKALIGREGQEEHYMGRYDGVPCVAKVLKGSLDSDVKVSFLQELRILEKLDHPNCQYFLGAKTTCENGGTMVLLELCAEGSLFDKYRKGESTHGLFLKVLCARAPVCWYL